MMTGEMQTPSCRLMCMPPIAGSFLSVLFFCRASGYPRIQQRERIQLIARWRTKKLSSGHRPRDVESLKVRFLLIVTSANSGGGSSDAPKAEVPFVLLTTST